MPGWMGIAFIIIAAAATCFGYYTYIRLLIRQTLHCRADELGLILNSDGYWYYC